MGVCVGWDRDINLPVFYLILISSLKHTSFLMMSSPDVSDVYYLISPFNDNVEMFYRTLYDFTYTGFLGVIPSYSYSSVSFMVYVATCFFGSEIGITPVWKVLYVGINHGVNCSFLMEHTSYFSIVYQLVPLQNLGNYYLGCSVQPQNIFYLYILLYLLRVTYFDWG